jgi:hypothetical protein
MAELKVTQVIVDSIGVSREKLIDEIRNGKKKGRIDEKTIWLDESEVPESFRPKNPDAPKEPESERDRILAQTELLKAQTLYIESQIKLELVQRKRDEPEILAKKSLELSELDKSLNARLGVVVLKENELFLREQTLKNNEQIIANKLTTVDEDCQQKRDSTDAVNLQVQQESDRIVRDTERKRKELDYLQTTITQVKTDAQPLTDYLDKYSNYAQNIATSYHTQQSYEQSNSFWNVSKKLKRLRKSLGF